MKPFDDFHTFTHRHGPNAKSQVATEDKMLVNVSGSILPVKLSTLQCTPPSAYNTNIKTVHHNRAVGLCFAPNIDLFVSMKK